MFGYFPWVFLWHVIRLCGAKVLRGILDLSDMGHSSKKPTALEGTWRGIEKVSRCTTVTSTYRDKRNKKKKKFTTNVIKNTAKPKDTQRKLVPLAVKKGKWTTGMIARLSQSQAYPQNFCKLAAVHMRKEFEARGEDFSSLKADFRTCLPPDACVDSYMNTLYGVEVNAARYRQSSVMDWLQGNKPEFDTVPKARGRGTLRPQCDP
jgi:hypothetical protein